MVVSLWVIFKQNIILAPTNFCSLYLLKDEVQELRLDNKIRKSLEEKQSPRKAGEESSKEYEWPCLG